MSKDVAAPARAAETIGSETLNSDTTSGTIKVSSHRYLHALNDAYIDIEDLWDIRYEMQESPQHCTDGDTYLVIVAETTEHKVYALNYPIRWSNKDWPEDCDTHYMQILCDMIRDQLKTGQSLRTFREEDELEFRKFWPWTWAAVIEKTEV